MLKMRIVVIGAALACAMAGGCAAPPAPRTPDGDHQVQFQGAALRYTLLNADEGKPGEPAVVFVHGWASSRSFWDAQMEGLGAERRLVALDLPGHGESEDVSAEHSFDLYAHAIAAVLDDAGVERAVLVGHSNGTPTVRQFWRVYPERTAGLVAVDGALRAFFTDPAEIEAFYEPLTGPDYLEWASDFVDQITAQMPDEAKRAHVKETMLATPQRVMVEAFAAGADMSIWEEDGIGVPLLVINADAPFWTEEYEAYVRSMGEDVEYVVFEGVSHFLMMDEPERFNRVLLEWLERKGF